MNNYKDLKIWQKGMEIVTMTFDLAKRFPEGEKYTLRPQIIRSAISIPSNIAEGTSRKTKKDFARFLEIALGSCFELETQVIIIEQNNLVQDFKFSDLNSSLVEEQKMIHSLTKKIRLET
jgi:four helix bundle protein